MTFDKIKYDTKTSTVTIHHHDGDSKNPRKKQTAEIREEPRPGFVAALAALAPDVAEICELPLDVERLTVRGVSFSWTDGVMGVTITALYRLQESHAPLVLNTPHKPEQPYSPTDEGAHLLTPWCVRRVRAVIEEAEAYMRGERAQANLFANESPAPAERIAVDGSLFDETTGEVREEVPACS